MTSQAFAEWAAAKGIALRFIEPREPNQNAYIDDLHGAFSMPTHIAECYCDDVDCYGCKATFDSHPIPCLKR